MPHRHPGRPTNAQADRVAELLAMDRRLIRWHPDGTATALVGGRQLPLKLTPGGNVWVGTQLLIRPDGTVLPEVR